MALKQLSQIVHRQAAVMSYSDAFFAMTVFFCGLSLLAFLLNKPSTASIGGDDAH
jgi:DHA2 family multidrug resistance protein